MNQLWINCIEAKRITLTRIHEKVCVQVELYKIKEALPEPTALLDDSKI
jgi:hypothetical protein